MKDSINGDHKTSGPIATPPGVPVIKCAMCGRGTFDGMATTPPASAFQHTLTRVSWRYMFAGLMLQVFTEMPARAETTKAEDILSAVASADALLAELERTAKP